MKNKNPILLAVGLGLTLPFMVAGDISAHANGFKTEVIRPPAKKLPWQAKFLRFDYSKVMTDSSMTKIIMSYERFCQQYPQYCQYKKEGPATILDYDESFEKLDSTNKWVNLLVKPAEDIDYYGVEDHWTVPNEIGDCEDYVILKLIELIKRGINPSALFLTVVLDEQGAGHAVLSARTNKGTYVLDNKTDEMKRIDQTPYYYVMALSPKKESVDFGDRHIWLDIRHNNIHLQKQKTVAGPAPTVQ